MKELLQSLGVWQQILLQQKGMQAVVGVNGVFYYDWCLLPHLTDFINDFLGGLRDPLQSCPTMGQFVMFSVRMLCNAPYMYILYSYRII